MCKFGIPVLQILIMSLENSNAKKYGFTNAEVMIVNMMLLIKHLLNPFLH